MGKVLRDFFVGFNIFQNVFDFQVEQSLLVTGFGYEHDDAWATNIDLFKEFTDISRVQISSNFWFFNQGNMLSPLHAFFGNF